jgi:hypothetical protein
MRNWSCRNGWKNKEFREPAGLPLIHTDNTDLKTGKQTLPRMNTDDRGSEKQNLPLINTDSTDANAGEQTSPRMNTDETDKDGELGKILPQPVSGEVYANRGPIAEPYANLG